MAGREASPTVMLLVDSTEPFQRRRFPGRLLVTITFFACPASRFVCSPCSNGTPSKERNGRKRNGRACRFGGLGHTPTLPQDCPKIASAKQPFTIT
jgi:hypothetical protein